MEAAEADPLKRAAKHVNECKKGTYHQTKNQMTTSQLNSAACPPKTGLLAQAGI